MISIRIYRCEDLKEREILRQGIRFFIKELLPKKKKLKLKIIVDDRLMDEHGFAGSCSPDDYERVKDSNNLFTINVYSKLNIIDKLSILAHELTHVKQYVTGQLAHHKKDEDITLWEGKEFKESKIKYERQPWERDAVKFEVKLTQKLLAETDFLIDANTR
jgi:hypothetical protein